jgi:hypothetical protein
MDTRTLRIDEYHSIFFISSITKTELNKLKLYVCDCLKNRKDIVVGGFLFQAKKSFTYKNQKAGFNLFEVGHKSYSFKLVEDVFKINTKEFIV